MSINVWGYLDEYEAHRDEILQAVDSVFKSGRLILGQRGIDFEQAYADYVGVRHGIGCDNGTNAITLSLKALNIGPGDEVITVPNTAIPTVSAIVATGARPVFVDVLPGSYLMDVSRIEDVITPRTRAIVPVHLYGQCVDMDPLLSLAQSHGLHVVEDCAQAHGALYRGRKAGSMSALSPTSFYPTKILGGYGDGGMVVTDDDELARRVRRLRFYGAEGTYYALEQGYNCRLDEVHAAILLTKLPHLEEYVERRRAIASTYDRLLADSTLELPRHEGYGRHAYYLYVVRHPLRDELIEALARHDINVNVSYRWPIHTMPAYANLGYREGSFPVTEAAANEILSLPMYPTLTDEQVVRVCEVLHDILKTL